MLFEGFGATAGGVISVKSEEACSASSGREYFLGRSSKNSLEKVLSEKAFHPSSSDASSF